MTRVHSKFRILSVSRCLSTERISPSRIRCAIEEVKESIGQKKGKLIGIAIEKCPLAVVLMLGILESGNAFIFIPSEAESYVQVLCKRFKVNRLIRRCEMPNSERISVDSNVLWVKRCSDFRMPWNSPISYAIQTSGTTGKPKTVHVTWDCIYANISDFRDRFFVTDSDVILQLTSLTFDPSMVEILLAAETGAELVIFTEDIGLPTLSAQPALLAKLISQIRPTFLQMTPSCLVQLKHDFLADLLGPRSAVRVLILGGEAFPLNLVNSVRSPENRTRVFNVYGVTEVSCWASVQEIGFGEKKICAGEPIIDTELLIDDVEVVIDGKRFCFVDFGMEKAIPHRTGDLGHYSNGEIVVIGRNKPNAILPSTEVEDLVLKEFSQVLLAKIVFDRNFAVLFYKSEEHLDSEIMEAIVAHLPSNKRPGLVCHVDDWPVTKNGKVDDEALLLEARKQIQLESSDSVKSIFKEYGVSLEEDKEETFQNLGFTSLQATELLFKLAPLIEEEMVGEVHRLLLSDEGKVADLLKVLDYGSLKDSERKASVSDLQLVEEENSCELLWESDLKKCIDASPVVLDGLVFIGSHAGIFTVVNLETGEVKLRLNVEGRIEKTCGFCEKYVAFGTYKGKLYVLDRSSLEMSAVFNVGEEVIKCTPVFDKSNKLYCGSHDRQLVKFNIEDNSVDYRVPVNGAIVSTPLLLNNETLAVATLNGFVYLVDQNSGEIRAETCLKSPVFAPVIPFPSCGFIVTTVTGMIALYSHSFKELSRIDLQAHHYDSPCVVSDSDLVSCGQNGTIHVVHFNGVQFELRKTILWKDSLLVRAPVIADDFLLVSSTAGTVVCIRKEILLADGTRSPSAKKLLQLEGEAFGTAVVVKTGTGYKLVGIMVPPSTPSSVRPLDVDTVVYNFVKRTKPELLLEMFGKNRCRELEQGDHRFDRSSFLSALEKIREDSKEEKCEAGETSERKEPSNTSKRSKVTITPELAVFDYFYERQNSQALKLLFDEEARKDYGRKVDRMGIHMPSVFRMYAYHRRLRLKHENKECTEIWKCQLCKKEFRGIGYGTLLMNHIGVHERIPIPCVIDGCEKILHYPGGLFHHLKRTHVRYVEHLTAQQFYRYKKSQKRFYKKAKKLYDKYFPPESFIRFNDTKMTCTSRDFEDPKCRECGEIVDHSIARRVHTAQHLGLVYNCVFDGCDVQLILSHLSPHYNKKHKTKIADLNEQQMFAHKRMKLEYGKIMKEAVPKYFPYKTAANNEEIQD